MAIASNFAVECH